MAGGEGEAVLGRRADRLPPFAVDGEGLKGPRPRDQVLQDDVRDQRAAAHRAENAHAEGPRPGKAHQRQREQEEQDPLFAQQRDELEQGRENDARVFGERVHQTQDPQIEARKSVHQPRGGRGHLHSA